MSGRVFVNRGLGAVGAPYAINAVVPRTASVLANGLMPNRHSPFATELEMNSSAFNMPHHEKGLE